MKNTSALTTPPNPSKEKTTWGNVCQQVGFSDNLYRVCRDKLGNDFQPYSSFGGDYDFEDDGGEMSEADFDKQLRKSAQPVPPPPPEDWKYEPEGFMESLMYGDLPKKIMLYGGGALVLWFLYDKYMNKPAAAPALPASVPTTVQIPDSLKADATP